jgi:hypothetical protein
MTIQQAIKEARRILDEDEEEKYTEEQRKEMYKKSYEALNKMYNFYWDSVEPTTLPSKIKLLKDRAGYPAGEYMYRETKGSELTIREYWMYYD